MTDDAVVLFHRVADEYHGWWQTLLGTLADALERQAVLALARDVDGRTTLDASCGMRHYPLALEPS